MNAQARFALSIDHVAGTRAAVVVDQHVIADAQVLTATTRGDRPDHEPHAGPSPRRHAELSPIALGINDRRASGQRAKRSRVVRYACSRIVRRAAKLSGL